MNTIESLKKILSDMSSGMLTSTNLKSELERIIKELENQSE